MVWFWVYAAVSTVVLFVYLHWRLHRRVGRRLAPDAIVQWRALSGLGRLRLRYAVRCGREVEDRSLAELAATVARAEAAEIGPPHARRNGAAVTAVIAACAAGAFASDAPELGTWLVVWAALSAWGVFCQPRLVRSLDRAAAANEVAAAS
jgi:hypothetical protein